MDGGAELATTVLHRFSVQDYHRMAETGVFDEMRIELINGAILDMAPLGTSHVLTVMQLTELFASLVVDKRGRLSVQNSVRLDARSEPEPDIVLVSAQADRTSHPAPPHIMLVVEVADSSLAIDRDLKAPLYAGAGIAEYWIVNLVDRCIEVHREPGPDGYRQVSTVPSGHVAPLAFPDLQLAVADILPPVAA